MLSKQETLENRSIDSIKAWQSSPARCISVSSARVRTGSSASRAASWARFTTPETFAITTMAFVAIFAAGLPDAARFACVLAYGFITGDPEGPIQPD